MLEVAVATADRYAALSTADLDAVFALHMKATAAVGRPDLIKPESREFFARILSGEGRIIGAFRDGALIAYGVLQLELPPSEDARPILGLSAQDGLAKLAGASVLPDIWGGGIHDVLIETRIQAARRLGLIHLYSTSAPGNVRSWENLLDGGFSVRALVEKYGGHVRYILYRDISAPARTLGEGVWCPSGDIERQRMLISAGHAGTHWRKLEDGTRDVLYRQPS